MSSSLFCSDSLPTAQLSHIPFFAWRPASKLSCVHFVRSRNYPRKRCALPHSRVVRVRLMLFSSAALHFSLRYPIRLSPPVPRHFAHSLRLRVDFVFIPAGLWLTLV